MLRRICLFVQAEKHYTVIVSLDGFRWDYPQLTKLLSLTKWHGEGVKATTTPSFPFQNLSAPLYHGYRTGPPDHHGIVANSFWDLEPKKEVYKMNKPATRNDASCTMEASPFGSPPILTRYKNREMYIGWARTLL